jgi:hypothetical protein
MADNERTARENYVQKKGDIKTRTRSVREEGEKKR